MLNAFLCRYGGQDIHTLLGKAPGELTHREKLILAHCINEHMRTEFEPRPGAS